MRKQEKKINTQSFVMITRMGGLKRQCFFYNHLSLTLQASTPQNGLQHTQTIRRQIACV